VNDSPHSPIVTGCVLINDVTKTIHAQLVTSVPATNPRTTADPTGSTSTTTAAPNIQAAAAAMLRRPLHSSVRTSSQRRRCSNVFLPRLNTLTVAARGPRQRLECAQSAQELSSESPPDPRPQARPPTQRHGRRRNPMDYRSE
jgi:hypothetical protein